MSEELLRLENLSIDYKVNEGYLSAVKDVNFSINKGEIFAVVGESGCGKVIFKGRDLREATEKEMEKVRGKEIGMIFQNPLDSLNPVYTVGSQVAEAIELDKVDKTEAWNRVVELFKDVKMPDAEERAKSFPHELSGGMRQRVMIAMMISRNPELLIADEPTTALDVTIEAQILAIIKALKEQFNTAVMLITHNFGLVAEVADKIGVMYAGEMVETGDVFEIFKNPVHPYTRLLMAALPRKTKNEGRLQTIEGNVPRITEKKPGCRFANRCPYATEKCKTEDPPMVMVGEDHMVRCHEIGKEEK